MIRIANANNSVVRKKLHSQNNTEDVAISANHSR